MKRIAIYGLTGLMAAMLTSCDLYERFFKKGDREAEVIKKEVVLPQDREAIQATADPKAYTPEAFKSGVIKGDWAIEKVYGEDAVGEKAPFIKFAENEGRIYGNNGCNTINAEYKYNPADSTLTFSNVAVTMMLCHQEGITDYLINKALDETRHYSLSETEGGYALNLYDAAGRDIMTLSHQNLDFLNGTWRVEKIDDETVDVDNMKLVFDVDENKVHGNTGCNVLNGRFETDMDTPNTFSFEAIAVTMMLCPKMEYQTALLVALEDACRAMPINKNTVLLLNSSGKAVLTLVRSADK